MEIRRAIEDLTVFTLDLGKTIVPANAKLEDFRIGPGHEGLLPRNPKVASFHYEGQVYFNLTHEIVGKTAIVRTAA
jgi:hypothetical protein